MHLTLRITIAMALLAAISVAAVGLHTYRNLEAAILPREMRLLESDARFRAGELNKYVGGASSDALALSRSPAMKALARQATGSAKNSASVAYDEEGLAIAASLFRAQLEAKPAYLQVRYIAADEDGHEIVRVDRSLDGERIYVVPAGELQTKSQRPYFQQALGLTNGETGITSIELNQEHGVIATPHLPVLRAIAPVFDIDDELAGVIVINVDMRSPLQSVRAAIDDTHFALLANEAGGYLVHFDRAREFESELGEPARIQDEFPAIQQAMLADTPTTLTLRKATGEEFSVAVVPQVLAGRLRVVLFQAVAMPALIAQLAPIRRSSLTAGSVAVLGSVVLAALLSHSLVKPRGCPVDC